LIVTTTNGCAILAPIKIGSAAYTMHFSIEQRVSASGRIEKLDMLN
jgi:hypothetical protein